MSGSFISLSLIHTWSLLSPKSYDFKNIVRDSFFLFFPSWKTHIEFNLNLIIISIFCELIDVRASCHNFSKRGQIGIREILQRNAKRVFSNTFLVEEFTNNRSFVELNC